jgi:hypothetical protein
VPVIFRRAEELHLPQQAQHLWRYHGAVKCLIHRDNAKFVTMLRGWRASIFVIPRTFSSSIPCNPSKTATKLTGCNEENSGVCRELSFSSTQNKTGYEVDYTTYPVWLPEQRMTTLTVRYCYAPLAKFYEV